MVDEVPPGIAATIIAAAVAGVLTLIDVLITWPEPLTVGFIGAIFGGLVTSPAFVYLGYFLSERANRERAEAEKKKAQAKAALWLGIVHGAFKEALIALPKEPEDVKAPSTELSFTMNYFAYTLSPQALVNAYFDLPDDVQDEAVIPMNLAPVFAGIVVAAKERAEKITLVRTEGQPSWLDEHRAWTVEDAKDAEFVRLYRTLSRRRQQLIGALDKVHPKLEALWKVRNK